jgi:putative transposase
VLDGYWQSLAEPQGMSRALLFQQSEVPYHVTARSNNRDWFSLPLEQGWDIFKKRIIHAEKFYNFKTHAFVLMGNHYHWLMTTPDRNLAEGMCHFQTQSSWEIARKSNRINRIYGARYKPTLIETPWHFSNALRYIYQNPIRAGVCSDVRNYAWSSFHDESLVMPLPAFEEFIPKIRHEYIRWLNTVPEQFQYCMRKALRRSVFKFPRNPKTNRPFSGDEFM